MDTTEITNWIEKVLKQGKCYYYATISDGDCHLKRSTEPLDFNGMVYHDVLSQCEAGGEIANFSTMMPYELYKKSTIYCIEPEHGANLPRIEIAVFDL